MGYVMRTRNTARSAEFIFFFIFQMSKEEEFPFVWAMVYYPLVIGMLIINCFADKPPRYSHDGEKSDVRYC